MTDYWYRWYVPTAKGKAHLLKAPIDGTVGERCCGLHEAVVLATAKPYDSRKRCEVCEAFAKKHVRVPSPPDPIAPQPETQSAPITLSEPAPAVTKVSLTEIWKDKLEDLQEYAVGWSQQHGVEITVTFDAIVCMRRRRLAAWDKEFLIDKLRAIDTVAFARDLAKITVSNLDLHWRFRWFEAVTQDLRDQICTAARYQTELERYTKPYPNADWPGLERSVCTFVGEE